MKFILPSPVYTKKGKKNTWIDPGTYEVIRLFGENKVMINVSHTPEISRLITVVPLRTGTLIR